MDVVEFSPTPDQWAHTFGGVAPVMTVRPGTALRLWSPDAFGGQLTSTSSRASRDLTGPGLNPQTGPFWVEGAEPGDVLALHLAALEPAASTGVSTLVPFFGGLTSTDRTATLQPALPERTWVYEVDSAARTVTFVPQTPGCEDLAVPLPLAPMLGTVGVAPAAGEVRTTLVPDAFGGNTDCPDVRAGTTVFLRVNVPGALFSLGDGHYRQGEGESCGTAVEGAMTSTVVVELLKGADAAGAPTWPSLQRDDWIGVIGSGRPLEDAWRAGQVDAVRWLAHLTGLDDLDAYQLLSQVSEVPLANVVDANFSVLTRLPLALLPPAAAGAHAGLHAHLRQLAAGL